MISKKPKVVMIREKLEQWLKHATDVLIRYLKWIQFWKEIYKPEPDEEWHELFTEALANERKINDYLDVLMFGTGKLQNHWIIEMGEMKATITAKNIEQIKSFLSRQKETYKVPYEVHPEDRPRQCVFCGTSNDLNFLPLDRTGNRRFAPVMTDMSKAEVHILDNEAESKAYIEQAWAEAMVLYRQGNVFLGFTKEIEEEAKRLQKEFMPEDTNAGIIQAFLDDYDDDYVCTRILFDEALHRTGEMKQWEGKEIANIMNNAIVGWKPHGTHRFGKEYGIQRSWKRMKDSVKKDKDGFIEVPEQLEIPFE